MGGRVDDVKTEYTRDDVPLDARLAEVLLQWRSASVFPRDEDWVFANPVTGRPYHQESLQKSQIKRAAKLAKLGEDIGWHTFRHTYRSWLDETGGSDESATRTDASRFDPNDDECLWAGHDGNETPGKQPSCRAGIWPQFAEFGLKRGSCDATVNCSHSYWGITGTCRERANLVSD